MIKNGIQNTLNPFEAEFADNDLYCLATGKAVSQDIATDLTSIQSVGKQWMETFESECHQDPSRFEKQIRRKKSRTSPRTFQKEKQITRKPEA